MKRLLSFLLLLLCLSAHGQLTITTATVNVTNLTGTITNQTITVNGALRYWTNVLVAPNVQILTNGAINTAASNLFVAYAISPAPGCSVSTNGTNGIILRSFPGFPMVVTISSGWGTVALSTNTLTNATVVRVPLSAVGNVERTNVESGLVEYLNDSKATNVIATNAPAFTNFAAMANSSTFTGSNSFTGPVTATHPSNALYGVVGNVNQFSNAGAALNLKTGYKTTNAIVYGGNDALVVNGDITLTGLLNSSQGVYPNTNQSWGMYPDGGFLMGDGTNALFDIHMPDGFFEFYDKYNGATNIAYDSLGGLYVAQIIAPKTTLTGTNVNSGTVEFSRTNNSGLANGVNSVDIANRTYVKVSGPTGAFSITGFNGGRDGRVLIVENATGQTMTVLNDSGLDSAANRIYTGTGADIANASAVGMVVMIYDSASTHWVVISSH